MDIHLRTLDRRELAGFRPYLLPDARLRLEQGDGQFLALGAVTGRSSCGAAAALLDGDSAQLTDLFVDEAARRRGVGGALLDSLLEELRGRGAARVWAGYSLRGDELAAMDALLSSRGFSPPRAVSRVFRTHSACYHDSIILKRAFQSDYRTPGDVTDCSCLPAPLLSHLSEGDGVPYPLSWEANSRRADARLSVALVREGRVLAYLLCGESGDGGFVLLAANSREGAPATAFQTLLVELINRCYYQCGGDFPFYFSAVTDHAAELALGIMGENYTEYAERRSELAL